MTSSPPTIVVGIDLGSLTTKITLGQSYDHELVRNAHGGHTTPTAVTFAGKHRARLLGEDAAEVSRADGNTVGMLDRLLVGSLNNGGTVGEKDELAAFRRFQMSTYNANEPSEESKVHIPNMDEEYSTTALAAMLLGRVKRNVIATINRIEGGSNNGNDSSSVSSDNLHFVFAIPPSYPESTRTALKDAAFAASIPHSSVVESTECMAAVYQRKFGDNNDVSTIDNSKKKNVLVVDVGHTRTCVSILCQSSAVGTDTDEKKDENEETATTANTPTTKVEVLSTISSPTLGASLIDIALYHHFLSTHPTLSQRL